MSDSRTNGVPSRPDPDDVQIKRFEFEVKGRHEGRRLDTYLANRFPDYSRTFIKALIKDDRITVNGQPVKPSYSPCLLYTSPSPRDRTRSRMPSSA